MARVHYVSSIILECSLKEKSTLSTRHENRDRLVCGINNNAIWNELLAEESLAFEKVEKIATAIKIAARDAAELTLTKNLEHGVHRAHTKINDEVQFEWHTTATHGHRCWGVLLMRKDMAPTAPTPFQRLRLPKMWEDRLHTSYTLCANRQKKAWWRRLDNVGVRQRDKGGPTRPIKHAFTGEQWQCGDRRTSHNQPTERLSTSERWDNRSADDWRSKAPNGTQLRIWGLNRTHLYIPKTFPWHTTAANCNPTPYLFQK